MKVGIYISGLAQSFVNESVEKYAERFMNEMSYSITGTQYELKSEKVNYAPGRYSTVAVIVEKGEEDKVIYKFYDFKYNEILVEKFNSHSLLMKSFLLLLLIARKFPMLIKRIFNPASHNRPFQTFYLFMILGIMALAILFMLPAIFGMGLDFFNTPQVKTVLPEHSFKEWFISASKCIVPITALILLIIPNVNILIANIATEFVCANDYMEHGTQKQLVQGNLEKLVEYISENETDCKIHIHSYSFGSILALDYIYPYGNKVTANTERFCEAIITIGTPVELIQSYYTDYYKDRQMETGENMCWINVYSISDALATNFRPDATIGEAEFGITETSMVPENVNYEVAAVKRHGVIDFITLYSIQAHGMYWDKKTEGQSCLRLIYNKMFQLKLV